MFNGPEIEFSVWGARKTASSYDFRSFPVTYRHNKPVSSLGSSPCVLGYFSAARKEVGFNGSGWLKTSTLGYIRSMLASGLVLVSELKTTPWASHCSGINSEKSWLAR